VPKNLWAVEARFKCPIFGHLKVTRKTLNPWNHRADISAQAYLKPSKMAKINVTEFFLPNTLFYGECNKILNFVRDIWFEYIRGSWFFEIFRRSFTSGEIISKPDTKYKCEMSQFLGKCFVHASYHGRDIFSGTDFSELSI
jgi:hypothetical protein